MSDDKWPWYIDLDGVLVPLKDMWPLWLLALVIYGVVVSVTLFFRWLFLFFRGLSKGLVALNRGDQRAAAKWWGLTVIPSTILVIASMIHPLMEPGELFGRGGSLWFVGAALLLLMIPVFIGEGVVVYFWDVVADELGLE